VASPALQRPLEVGADLVLHSATKYIEGQGRVLAGALAGRKDLVSGPALRVRAHRRPGPSPPTTHGRA
jgi:O-succinylhomoserine sulfhydrylase